LQRSVNTIGDEPKLGVAPAPKPSIETAKLETGSFDMTLN